jgi:Ca-activated chloride channel family protein
MSFGAPAMLAALVLIPLAIAGYVAAGRRRAERAAALAAEGLVTTAPGGPGRPQRWRWRRHIPFAFFVAALTVLVVALARPMATVRTPRREGTVIVALDVSNSMRATDVKPSRVEAAKATARTFVGEEASAVRIGVVAFGDGAVVVQQPTTSHADVVAAIDRVSVGGATSIGQGVLTSLNTIAGKPITIDEEALQSDDAQVDVGYFGGATVVVFSDGENTNRPDPLSVGKVASVAGVRVYTVGVGTEAGTVLDVGGFNIATALDSDLLTQLASVTDGTYHAATDPGALAAISKAVGLHFKLVSEHTEITGLFCAVAIGLLLIGALLSLRQFGRLV